VGDQSEVAAAGQLERSGLGDVVGPRHRGGGQTERQGEAGDPQATNVTEHGRNSLRVKVLLRLPVHPSPASRRRRYFRRHRDNQEKAKFSKKLFRFLAALKVVRMSNAKWKMPKECQSLNLKGIWHSEKGATPPARDRRGSLRAVGRQPIA